MSCDVGHSCSSIWLLAWEPLYATGVALEDEKKKKKRKYMDEPWKYDAKWNMPDTKRYSIQFPLYEIPRIDKVIVTANK